MKHYTIKLDLSYENEVIKLLKTELKLNKVKEKTFHAQYIYRNKGVVHFFDFVEIGPKGQIERIYEIKTLAALKSGLNAIINQLNIYSQDTGAIVYLAYLDEKSNLQIVQLEDLKKNKLFLKPKDRTVGTFTGYYKALTDLCDNNASDIQYFYRGHSDSEYKSVPSIYRKNNIAYENQMFREAIRRNPSEFTEDMSTFDKLVKMQHYELPTRLLDITTNPLIALYFACKEHEKKDGEILIYTMSDKQIKYFDSDSVCILSNLSKRPLDFSFENDKDYLVYDIQQDKQNFNGDYLEETAIHDVFCVMPKLNNDRIVRQHGAFFIFGMGDTKDKPAELLDKPMSIKIRSSSKKDILRELQVLGIDEATLFPETDKVMKQIKNKYEE